MENFSLEKLEAILTTAVNASRKSSKKMDFDSDEIVVKAKKDGMEAGKKYASKYIFPSALQLGYVYVYYPLTNTFNLEESRKLNCILPKKLMIHDIKLNAYDFINWKRCYIPAIEPSKPFTYEENGQWYLNMFSKLDVKIKSYQSFPEPIKKQVQFILDFLHDVWANGNDDHYQFLKCYFAGVLLGRKNEIALVLQADEGVGKTIFCRFMGEILKDAYHKTTSKETILHFNYALQGKMMLLIDELNISSTGEWLAVSSALKDLITSDKLNVRKMRNDPYTVKNLLNIVIASNHQCIKISPGDRHYFVVNMSEKKKNDHKYFDKLAKAMFDKNVQQAFYNYMYEFGKTDQYKQFNYRLAPVTAMKKDLANEHLPHFYQFLKEYILRKGKNINKTFAEFYELYCERAPANKCSSKIEVSKMLSKLGFSIKTKALKKDTGVYSTQRCIEIDCKELYKVFDKNGWIHEVDDIADNCIDHSESESEPESESDCESESESEPEEVKPQKKQKKRTLLNDGLDFLFS